MSLSFGTGAPGQWQLPFDMAPPLAAPPSTTGPEPDWTATVRHENYRFELLSSVIGIDTSLGFIRGVLSCSLDWSIHSQIQGTGTMEVETPVRVPWSNFLVRVWQITRVGEDERGTVLGTYWLSSPTERHTSRGITTTLDLTDATTTLAEQHIVRTTVCPQGANLIEWLTLWLRESAYTGPVRIPNSGVANSREMVWDPVADDGITVLRVVNDVMERAGYFAIHADPVGVLTSRPYVPPGDRPATWNLSDDAAVFRHRYTGGITATDTMIGKPNHWVAWSRVTQEGDDAPPPPMRAEAWNRDPNHPNSIENARVQRTEREVDVDVSTQQQLDDHVTRRRDEAMANQRTFELEARYIPVQEHEVVEVTHLATGIVTHASVSARSLDCTPGATVRLTLRETPRNEPTGQLQWGPPRLKGGAPPGDADGEVWLTTVEGEELPPVEPEPEPDPEERPVEVTGPIMTVLPGGQVRALVTATGGTEDDVIEEILVKAVPAAGGSEPLWGIVTDVTLQADAIYTYDRTITVPPGTYYGLVSYRLASIPSLWYGRGWEVFTV